MMASTTTKTTPPPYVHTHKSHLPPSPPPSPPNPRHRHRKRISSFEKFANTPLPSPPSEAQAPLPNQADESLILKIILTPLLFTSFILSLTLVNLRDRLNRKSSHPTPSTSSNSLLTFLYPSAWLDTEPYQDPDDSTWARRPSVAGHIEPHDAIGPRHGRESGGTEGKKGKKKKSWHLNKKIRKVAKLEVSDAVEMRGMVMGGMLIVGVCSMIGVWVVGRWMVGMAMQ